MSKLKSRKTRNCSYWAAKHMIDMWTPLRTRLLRAAYNLLLLIFSPMLLYYRALETAKSGSAHQSPGFLERFHLFPLSRVLPA